MQDAKGRSFNSLDLQLNHLEQVFGGCSMPQYWAAGMNENPQTEEQRPGDHRKLPFRDVLLETFH